MTERAPEPSRLENVPPSAPRELLLPAAALAVLASTMGVLVVPGLRGNGSQQTVESWGFFSAAASLATLLLVGGLSLVQATFVVRSTRVAPSLRAVSFASTVIVVVLGISASRARLETPFLVGSGLSATLLSLAVAYRAMRAPHTRVGALLLAVFGFGALARIGGWEMATFAGDAASPALYALGRALATLAVVLDGLGQLLAVAWLGVRGGAVARVFSYGATAGGVVLTWAASRGVHAGAPLWESALHTALASASPAPPSYGLGAVAAFLSLEGVLLALVAISMRAEPVGIVGVLALVLVSRAGLDVPLRALAAIAAAQTLLLLSIDDRALWKFVTTTGDVTTRTSRSGAIPVATRAPGAHPGASEPGSTGS